MSSSRSRAAVVAEGNAKTAAREWVGWEEEVVLGDDDGEERKVCYYLLCAAPQDSGKSQRDLALVGKYWGPGNIAYSADVQFLLSLDTALESGSASATVEALASEITELRWKSRREIMDWLTSLVSDPPYGAFGLTCPDHHDGGSAASKGILAAFGENKEGFTWICKLPHLDQRRKHYKSFWRGRLRISVYDFVFIKSEGRESHVAYVEDMYEDASEKKMVVARWFEEQDGEHGAVLPADLYCREIFFGYVLQDLRVEVVEAVAPVLNPEHFEMFKKKYGGRSSWQPFVCRRQIENDTVGPFDIAQQLQGYANQEIVKAIVASSSSTVVQVKPPNSNKGKAATTRLAAENHAGSSSAAIIGNKTMEKQKAPPSPCSATPSSSVVGDKAMEKQKPPPCSATASSFVFVDKTMEKQKQKQKPPSCSATPSSSVIGEKTMEKQKPPPCSATPSCTVIGDKTMDKKKKQKPPPCSATPSCTVIGDKTMEKKKKQKPPPCSATPSSTVIGDKTMEKKKKQKAPPCSATPSSAVIGEKTMEKKKKRKAPPCSATLSSAVIGEKTMEKQKPPPCSATASSTTVIGDKTMEKQKPPACRATPSSSSAVMGDKAMEKQKQKEMPPPCSATQHSVTNGQTVESSVVPRSVVNCQTTAQNQPPPSDTGNAAASDASTMVNPAEKMLQPGSRLEALSQDSSVRGCWFKCVVVKRNEQNNTIWVRYQDLRKPEGKGQLKEWLKVARTAEPDRLGIRLAKRAMLRPQLPSHYRKIESPVDVGVIVDAQLNGGWWEGIVLQQETAGHVKVYLQGEGRLVEFKVDSLRKSFEWREEQWMPLDARTDVAAKITLDLKKKKKAAAAAPSPAGLLLQPQEDGSASSVPPRKRILELDHSFEEERLQDGKGKGPADEPAKTVPDKGGAGDGMSRGGGSAGAKRCRVDPANSDGLNCAECKGKAGKSSGVKKMGSSEGSGSQGGASGSASSGGAAPVKPAVPMQEICVTNAEAPVVAMDESEVIDLTMYD
ncbi:hypothetical protein VPH35_090145 [Triticum aestivum]|uniref:uncharacterized protein n=1 Tax=Triticum aestivum TaxID=4565 RepID=UPI00084482B0|nr:uncharacterized protein LOC123116154 [Triticum aestivum]